MRRIPFAAATALAICLPLIAGCTAGTQSAGVANPCQAEIDKINEALARTTMTPEGAQAIDAEVKKGEALCKEGNTGEGIAVLKAVQKSLGV